MTLKTSLFLAVVSSYEYVELQVIVIPPAELSKRRGRSVSAGSHFFPHSPHHKPTIASELPQISDPGHCHLIFVFNSFLGSAMADNPPTAPDSSNRGRGSGRRRGRGGAPGGRSEVQHNPGDGAGKASKSRGRGGKTPGDRNKKKGDKEEQTHEVQPSATATLGTKQVAAATDDADDGEVCFICASAVEHTSVSPCNHRTCHICALRLRALYKNKGCAHCRVSGLYFGSPRILGDPHGPPLLSIDRIG